MAVEYHAKFDLDACIKKLGLEEHGRVQRRVAEEILELSDPYVPFKEGALKDSGNVEEDSTDVVWDTPYATYMWNGIVYEDPKPHCAGINTENGWRSRKNVQKVPAKRSIEYHNGNLRSSHWVEKMLQDGGREKIEKAAREEIKK